MESEKAGKIVVNCIRAVSHVKRVSTTKTLAEAEVHNQNRVDNVVTLIVHSDKIGVPSEGYRISSTQFNNVSPDTIVKDLIKTVREKSIEAHPNPVEDFAALVASHMVEKLKKELPGEN